MPRKWSKIDHLRLVSFVDREARKLLSLRVNITDLLQEEDGVKQIVEDIYTSLSSNPIKYAIEPSTSSPTIQDIRTSLEILESLREGTCLDLALLFCGICLGCELLPVLIVLDGHALVAVSRTHNQYQWENRGSKERKLFENIKVDSRDTEKVEQIQALITSEAYLAVECTGFAQSNTLCPPWPEGIDRNQQGRLSFERAIEAGLEQFTGPHKRPFLYALDMVTAQRFWHLDPLTEASQVSRAIPSSTARGTSKDHDPLPYLLDRSEQEEALKQALLEHRSQAPGRPLICLIHGNEKEYHKAFVDRLEKISLPRILGFWYPEETRKNPILRRTLSLSLGKITEANLADQSYREIFWGDLANAIVGDRNASPADVIQQLSRQKVAVMIDVSLLSRDLMNLDFTPRLDGFLKFWNEWQNVSENLLLMICISFRYQTIKRSLWERITGKRNINNDLQDYIEGLDFRTYENLYGVCLPKLCAIPQSEAEKAIENTLISERYGFTPPDVYKIYNNPECCTPEGGVSMYDLVEQLKEAGKA